MTKTSISSGIFRAYDVRGLYGQDITPEIFYRIGLAAGHYLLTVLKGKTIIVGNDIRASSTPLSYAFNAGLAATGVNVAFTGTTAFGQTLFFGTQKQSGLIAFITASHLPPEWNGVKFYYGDGVGFPEPELMKIRDLALNGQDYSADWRAVGQITMVDATKPYAEYFLSKVSFHQKHRIALDCGGGSMTLSAPSVFTSLGIDVVPVFCEADPLFSHRPSDPKPKNLTALVQKTKDNHCEFGVAFDGDGDRAVIVDDTGRILSADETGIIIGKYGLPKKKGIVIVNVECSKAVPEQLAPLGYTMDKIKVGHTFLTYEAKKQAALLGIESSGHLILPEYFLFDDAIVVPLKIAQILEQQKKTLSTLVKDIPMYPRRKEEIDCSDDQKFIVIEHLKQKYAHDKNVDLLDGIRINLPNGWVLIRASNTSPIIRLTVEADTTSIVDELTDRYTHEIEQFIRKK